MGEVFQAVYSQQMMKSEDESKIHKKMRQAKFEPNGLVSRRILQEQFSVA